MKKDKMKPKDVFRGFTNFKVPTKKAITAFKHGEVVCYFEDDYKWRGAIIKYKDIFYSFARYKYTEHMISTYPAISDNLKYVLELAQDWMRFNCNIIDKKLYTELHDLMIIEAI